MAAPRLKKVSIRMYRGILGDCFLVRTSVEADGTESVKSILIDCGVLQNVAAGSVLLEKLGADVIESVGRSKLAAVRDGPIRIMQVAADVLSTVGNQIDLLIVTHEHYDHLSGFGFSREAFLDKGVFIDRLWMAWTENFADKQANSLRARLAKGRQALAAAASLADSIGADVPEALVNAAALAGFAGPPSVGPGMAAAGGQFGTGDIMQMLKDKVGSASTDYLEPGQVLDLQDFGLKAYILGPPPQRAPSEERHAIRRGRKGSVSHQHRRGDGGGKHGDHAPCAADGEARATRDLRQSHAVLGRSPEARREGCGEVVRRHDKLPP